MTTMTHELVRIGSRQAGMHSATVWKIPSADSFVLTTLVSSSRRQDETAKTPANTNTSAQNQATDVTLYSKPGSPNTPAPDVVLYLHGFPAQSLDHRQNAYGDVSERFAQKVMEATCGVGLDFCTLNFRGTPGSGGKFFDKTVSGEIADAKAVMQFLKRLRETEDNYLLQAIFRLTLTLCSCS
ncbi:unnamed protein product [Amoebophrya sp. A25]|nr:unnamed protein product [Amoebophrya sp. A25]|eukprot:GSA25T00010352001.1